MGLLCAQLMLMGVVRGDGSLFGSAIIIVMITELLISSHIWFIKHGKWKKKRHQDRSSQPVITDYWIFTQKMTKQLILEDFTKTNNTGNLAFKTKITTRAKYILTFTHMVTLPALEILAKHGQHSITDDQWVWACAQTCAWSYVQKRNQWQPRCMVWIRRLSSDTRHWHTREYHGPVW